MERQLEIALVLAYHLSVRIFKNMWFDRFADKEGITDAELVELINQLEAGRAEADLGGGVFKMRIARQGEGKSGGYRVIVFFKSEDRTFYVYGFAKSVRSNISQKELRLYKKMAKTRFAMSDKDLDAVVNAGEVVEIQGAI